MRPLHVLFLALLAIGVLLLAVFTLPGGDSSPNGISPPVGDGGGVSQPPTPNADLAPVADPRPGEAPVEREPDTRESTTAAVRFDNSLSGLVVNANQVPIAGALVTLTLATPTATFTQVDPADHSRDRKVRTNAEGRYELRAVEPNNYYALIVTHGDYARQIVQNVHVGDGGDFHRNVVLGRGATLAGTVSDKNGNAVPGALVALQSMVYNPDDTEPDRQTTRSEADGRYEIKNIPAGTRFLVVQADGFANIRFNNLIFSGDKLVSKDVRLVPAVLLGGRVLSEDDQPIANATVQATSLNTSHRTCQSRVKTDAQGKFLFEDIGPGEYSLIAEHELYERSPIPSVTAGALDVEFKLASKGNVEGTVVDAATGKPVPSGSVRLRHASPQMPQTSVTRFAGTVQRGRFEILGVPKGTYVVEATCNGFAPTYSDVFQVERSQTVSGIEVRMSSGGSIRGVVVDSDGKPVAGARVASHDAQWSDDVLSQIMGGAMPSNATSREVTSDAKGRFDLPNLRPGDYQIRIHHRDYCMEVLTGITVQENGAQNVGNVKLRSGGSLQGTLYDSSGNTLAGGTVELRAEAGVSTPGIQLSTTTDRQGRFLFERVRPGSYFLSGSGPAGPDSNVLLDMYNAGVSERPVVITEGDVVTQDVTIGI